jgi:two-component SAPR family response regulator
VEWVEGRRRTHALGYLSALLALGDWELGRRRYNEARRWYELAHTEDDLLEQPVYGLVQCLIETGAPVEAKALLQRYATHLDQELGEEPSARLAQLLKPTHC